jgi:hypothetical protein
MSIHRSAFFVLCAALWACTSWQAEPVAPTQLGAGSEPRRIRVTRTDGSQVVLEDARVLADGVHGRWERLQAFIPVGDIGELEVRRQDDAGTIGLIAGLVGVAGLTATLITESGEPPDDLRNAGLAGAGPGPRN